jgi:hypothetical protein
MSQQDARERTRNRMDELRAIRDEIRLDLHLATMDLKDEWRKLERELPEPAAALHQLEEATAESLDRLAGELRRFRDRLRRAD